MLDLFIVVSKLSSRTAAFMGADGGGGLETEGEDNRPSRTTDSVLKQNIFCHSIGSVEFTNYDSLKSRK